MPHDDLRTELAIALLRRVEAVLHLPYSPPETVEQPMFVGNRSFLGSHAIDSLDLIEAMVAVDEDLGVLLLDRVALREAASLEGIAELVLKRADRQAVERFCVAWAAVGLYQI